MIDAWTPPTKPTPTRPAMLGRFFFHASRAKESGAGKVGLLQSLMHTSLCMPRIPQLHSFREHHSSGPPGKYRPCIHFTTTATHLPTTSPTHTRRHALPLRANEGPVSAAVQEDVITRLMSSIRGLLSPGEPQNYKPFFGLNCNKLTPAASSILFGD